MPTGLRKVFTEFCNLDTTASLFKGGTDVQTYLNRINLGRKTAGREGELSSIGFEALTQSRLDISQLNPSKNFNVSSVLPSTSYSEMLFPQTLEDYFTTFHQASLEILHQ